MTVSGFSVRCAHHPRLEALAQSLIALDSGTVYSTELLVRSVDALKTSAQFSSIVVDTQQGANGGMQVHFELIAAQFIKDIHITGAFPLYHSQISEAMSLYPGDPFDSSKRAVYERLIERLYSREGFIEPRVTITAHTNPRDGTVRLRLRIKSGEAFRLAEIQILGAKRFSNLRLKSMMQLWRAGFLPFSPQRVVRQPIVDDVARIRQLYQNKGYLDVAVEPEIIYHQETKSATLQLKIDEGHQYRFQFSGIERKLVRIVRNGLKELISKPWTNQQRYRMQRVILQQLKQRGFWQVSAEPAESTVLDSNGDSLRLVHWHISASQRIAVRTVNIVGNQAFDNSVLEQYVISGKSVLFSAAPFDTTTLEQDCAALEGFYANNGYLNATVIPSFTIDTLEAQVAIELRVTEGVQTIIGTITIDPTPMLSEKELRRIKMPQAGAALKKYELRSAMNTLAEIISERGYPHVQLKPTIRYSPDSTLTDIVLQLTSGPMVVLGDMYFSGNFTTKPIVFERELELTRGESFSLNKVLQGQQSIRNLQAISTVSLNSFGIKEMDDTVTVLVKVQERKPYFLEAAVGYNSETNLSSRLKLGTRNLLGLNKQLWIAGEFAPMLPPVGYHTELGFIEPRLFGTPISLIFNGFNGLKHYMGPGFQRFSSGFSTGLSRKWAQLVNTDISATYEYADIDKRVYESNRSDTELQPGDTVPRNLIQLTPHLHFDSRDSFLRPRRGQVFDVTIDVTHGLTNVQDNFLRLRSQASTYFSPFQWVTLNISSSFGYIQQTIKNTELARDQRFYLGGSADVRGFEEDMLEPAGGRLFYALSTELRFDLGKRFELPLFCDAGSVGNILETDLIKDTQFSVGSGVRYHTPVGPVGLLYALPLQSQPQWALSGRLHFTIGYGF